jgi:hypothetical protein
MEHLPVLAPLHAVIIVQETIPHATAIMTTARIARRRSESTSKSPTTRMLAKANTRATKNGESTVTGLLNAIQHGVSPEEDVFDQGHDGKHQHCQHQEVSETHPPHHAAHHAVTHHHGDLPAHEGVQAPIRACRKILSFTAR